MADPAGYRNPVTAGYSVDFPDPALIKAKDGFWYAFATGGPYDKRGSIGDAYKIARSANLTRWEKVGSVFNAGNRPAWADPGSGFWAPDIRYIGGRYVLYFTVHNTRLTPDDWDYAIGVATAPTPAGPWTDCGQPLVPPRPAAGGGYEWTIDPCGFVDTDGQRYLYWGSYNGGLHAVRLIPDGTETTGPVTQVASDRFEAPYVVRHERYYYLFASSSNCCAGATSGHAVFAGRSTSPLGPFHDREGAALLASRAGGTPVLFANGNRWVGTGHSSVVTDLSGQHWLAYHAVDRTDPYVARTNGWLIRPMLLDRLDWIDEWPVVNAGAGPSEHALRRPVTGGLVADGFDVPLDTDDEFRTMAGALDVLGGFVRLAPDSLAVSRRLLPGDVRVEADVRTTGVVGLVARYRSARSYLRAVVDVPHARLRLESVDHAQVRPHLEVPVPAAYHEREWATLVLQARDQTVTVTLGEAGLSDPLATFTVTVPQLSVDGGSVGMSGTGDLDNFAAAELYRPVTRAVPAPRIGRLDPAFSDEFDGGLGPGWRWRNESPDAVVADGVLLWPTETSDLTGDTAAKASLLLRAQPGGAFVVETKLGLDVGTDTVRDFQQAGLLVYADDATWLRLSHVAGGNGRFVEFGKRMWFTPRDAEPVLTFGGAMTGPPGDTTWLRLAHDLVPGTGEHRYRAGSSTDGRRWVWGAAWTLPADSRARIGLFSQGSTPETEAVYGKATARFDYFHVLR
ncbi:MAG TPA: family 43 glycosylhydrolase [Kribbellaceae bacterium]|nr:family 43 glycosylhydrolase [Kribbellaceae bacterium]